MNPTPKQLEAAKLLNAKRYTLLYGGARSGKTFLTVYWLVARALNTPGSRHLVARRYGVDVRGAIWKITLKDVLSILDLHIGTDFNQNEQEMEIRFPNGSVIVCTGLDDKERVDKVLGQEYATIYVNESQDVPWATIRTLRTRLSQRVECGNRFVADLNPTSTSHWTYALWFKGVDPESGEPIDTSLYGKLQMNPVDNLENLPDDYIKTELETLVGQRRSRFLLGEYSTTTELRVFSPTGYEWADFEAWAHDRWGDVRMVGGLDIGYEDADALAILAYIEGDPTVWLVYEYKARRSTISELAKEVQDALEWCRKNVKNNSKDIPIYGDTGGIGKKVIFELRNVVGIPVQTAYKQEKRMAIEFLQEETNSGHLKVPHNGIFMRESEQIVWQRDENSTILREIDEKAFHPDLMDAILYAYRFLWTYGNSALRKEIK